MDRFTREWAVTLATNCWDADWRDLLTTDHLKVLADRNQYDFADRVLVVNNVSDRDMVCAHAERAVKLGWITRLIMAEDSADDALRRLGIDRESFKGGYNYSICPLVAIHSCKTEYLLYFTGDSIPTKVCKWVSNAISCMSIAGSTLKVANLTWNDRYDEVAAESMFETQDFFVGYGFSDQCFLIRVEDFSLPIYCEYNLLSDRYPHHAGHSFEKRVDSWMRNHGYLRATYKHGSYLHKTHHAKRPARNSIPTTI